MTRRRWLQELLSLPWVIALWTRRLIAGSRAASIGLMLAPAPATASDSPVADFEALVAFAEVLVDSRLFSPDTRRDLTEHLADSASVDPDRRARYVTTTRLLDRLAGARFSQLPLGERAALMARHRLNVRLLTAEESAGAISDDARAVRTQVLPDLIGACWRSPAGWSAVGYGAFPGRCSDLTRYTRPEP